MLTSCDAEENGITLSLGRITLKFRLEEPVDLSVVEGLSIEDLFWSGGAGSAYRLSEMVIMLPKRLLDTLLDCFESCS